MENNISVKFLMAYHKPDILFENEMIVPINVGRYNLKKRAETDIVARDNLSFLEKAMIGDDTGDNISDKNNSYNELTALYWAWKNYDEIGNPTHIGLMHYRRHFIFKDLPNTFNECNEVNKDYLEKDLNFKKDVVVNILKNFDFIAKKPDVTYDTVYSAYLVNHRPENLSVAVDIIKEYFPALSNSCDKYLNGKGCYYLNMFVFPKDIFFDYCNYIFTILGEFEKRVDTSRMRFFISEFLTGIYIQHLLDEGYKGAFYPTMYIEEQAAIPVVYRIDKENIMEACVSINSLLKNLKNTNICRLCVICKKTDKSYISKEIEKITSRYKNCNIEYLAVDQELLFDSYDGKLLYALDRLQYNKVIFMTAQAICKGDISGMFRNSVDDYAIAGVRSYKVLKNSVVDKALYDLGLMDNEHYIDCDIMLVNIKRLRDFELVSQLIQEYKKGDFNLQDLINSVCYSQIRLMPLRQNFSTAYFEKVSGVYIPKKELQINYSEQELLNANKTALFVKFDIKKPWLDSCSFRAKDWFYHENNCSLYDDLEKGKVSIVIPIYNAEKYIEETLISLTSQTYKNLEILCVNDGSVDNTVKIINKFKRKDKRIKLINQENSGAAVARNNGLNYVTGEYTLILDADDLYVPDMIEVLVNKAKDTSAEIVICRSVGFDAADYKELPMEWSLLTDKIPKNPFVYTDMGPYLYSFVKGWSWDKLYSTKLIKRSQLRFQNLQNTNDVFFVFSIMSRAQSMAYVENVLVKHRRNISESISNNRVKNWYCFYLAISEIKKELEKCNVYKEVERAFINWILNFTLWYVRTEPYPLKNYLYILLKVGIFKEFNVYNHNFDYYINKEDYELFLTVQNIPVPAEANERVKAFYEEKEAFDIKSFADLVQIDKAGMLIKQAMRNNANLSTLTIPIALSCNEKYAKYTAVTIQSIIENANPAHKYEIYVLHTELKNETIKRLENIKGSFYSVKCINMEKNLPSKEELYVNEHITKETYYRFCIPEVINRPKIIYLDCDLIVLGNIADFYILDTKGAAISGINNFMNRNTYNYINNELKLNPKTYINAGVLIIDSQKYKSQKIKEGFLRLVRNEYRFLDQDIINILCKDNITLLPDRWNYQWHNHNEKKKLVFKQAEYDSVSQNPLILHFTTRNKAWNTPNWDLADRFWYYASHTGFFEEIIKENREAVKQATYDIRKVNLITTEKQKSTINIGQIKGVYEEEIERLSTELKQVESDMNYMRNSVSFRIGRFITFIPRKIRGLLRCIKDNGLKYTIIVIFKDEESAKKYKKRK